MIKETNGIKRGIMIRLICIVFMLPVMLSSQIDKSSYYSYGQSVFTDIYRLPYENSDSSKVAVLFKAANEALKFNKVKEGKFFGKYKAEFYVDIAFKASNGIIKTRKRYIDTVYFDDYYQTISKSIFAEGIEEFILENDKYEVEIKFEIKEKSYNNSKKHVLNLSDEKFFKPIFFQDNNSFRDLNPYILDNSIAFSSEPSVIFIPLKNSIESEFLNFEINKKSKLESSDLEWMEEYSIKGKADKIDGLDLKFKVNKADVTADFFRNGEDTYLKVPISREKITPGKYELLIKQNEEALDTHNFNIIWEDKPLSLTKLDYALDMLYYIATDEEHKKLMNSKNIGKDFLKFWKERDPTPSTPFNEALEQYYKRVDYAFFNYRTISKNDGAKTDRGKIYILYSRPDKIIEEYKGDKSVVIWKYPSLNKEFVFELISAGDYRLAEIKEE